MSAPGAQSEEVQPVSDDLEIGVAAHRLFEVSQGLDQDILDLAATYASDMIMIFCGPIEPSPGARQVEFLGQPPLGEDFEVSINGTEAYPRHPFPHRVVDLVGSGMGVQIPEFLEDDLPLPGHPESFIR